MASDVVGPAYLNLQLKVARSAEPQPDIVLARPREDYYAGRRMNWELFG
jgi:hypothetical protein